MSYGTFLRKHRVIRFFYFLWQGILNIHWAVSQRLSSFQEGKKNYFLQDGHFAFDQVSLIALSKRALKTPTPQALGRIVNQVARDSLQDALSTKEISTPDNIVDILLLLAHRYAHAAACVSCALESKRIPAKELRRALLGALPKSKNDLPCIECIELGMNCQSQCKGGAA